MSTETKLFDELIAVRVPPGDRWALTSNKSKVYNSLTDTLEAYFQQTQEPCDFKLSPLSGALYAIKEIELEKAPEPPKKYNLYGDYGS
jgi:hypothetical protein